MINITDIEDIIVHRAIEALLAPERTISLWGGSSWLVRRSHDRTAIASAIRNGPEERLYVEDGGRQLGWVRLVYGRSGWNVIDAWSHELSETIRPVMRYAHTIRDRQLAQHPTGSAKCVTTQAAEAERSRKN